MILITGSARVQTRHREAALALGIEHSVRSRGEPGCLAHNCHIDAEDSDRIVFVEKWVDLTAVQAHFAVPASGDFVRRLSALAAEAPEIRIFEVRELPAPGL